MPNEPVHIRLGRTLAKQRLVEFRFDQLTTPHFFIGGISGSGKSRMLTDLALQLIDQGCGATLVDPGGDLVEDVLAHQAQKMIRRGNKNVLKKLHYLEPGHYATCFRLDPFRFDPAKPIHPEVRPAAYRAWLHATVQRVGELVQLKQGQMNFEQNARLQRVLSNLLMAVGMAIDPTGRHLPLSAALILLQFDHPLNERVWEQVARFLDRDTRADFERLRGYRREEDRLREVESTINRLRSILTPVAKAIFSATSFDETVNPRRIILDRGVMLWNLRPTEYFSPDSKTTFGKLAIHSTLSAMMSMPRDLRQPHVLIIDEAAEFADEMLLWSLGAMRKTGDPFSIVLAGQDLSSFKKPDGFDMRSKVLSQCNLICFNQSWPEDTEVLARILFSGELSFAPLTQEVERDGGYRWQEVEETSESCNVGVGASQARGTTLTETDSTQHGTSVTDGTTATESDGTTASATETDYASDSKGETRPAGGGTGPKQRTQAAGTGTAASSGTMHTRSTAQTHTVATTSTRGHSVAAGASDTQTQSLNVGVTRARSRKKVPLHQVVREVVATGTLQEQVADQLEEKRSKIATQKRQQAFVKVQGEAACPQIRTRDVPDPFASPQAQVKMVEWVKRELFALHPYFTAPSLDPAADDQVVRDYLGAADEPVVVGEDRTDDMFDD